MTASTQRQSREVTVPLIRSDADLNRALVEIKALMDKDTLAQAEEDRLNTMTVLVEAYEREHFPIGPPDRRVVDRRPTRDSTRETSVLRR